MGDGKTEALHKTTNQKPAGKSHPDTPQHVEASLQTAYKQASKSLEKFVHEAFTPTAKPKGQPDRSKAANQQLDQSKKPEHGKPPEHGKKLEQEKTSKPTATVDLDATNIHGPRKDRSGSYVNAHKGRLVWSDSSGVHEDTVRDGNVIRAGKKIGTVGGDGRVVIDVDGAHVEYDITTGKGRSNKTIDRDHFECTDIENGAWAFRGTGADNKQLDMFSARDAKGYCGIWSAPKNPQAQTQERNVVMGNHVYDVDGNFLGYLSSNGTFTTRENRDLTLNQSGRADWEFEGSALGPDGARHRRWFKADDMNCRTRAGGFQSFINGVPHYVENGMVINAATGEQFAYLHPPVNNAAAGMPTLDGTRGYMQLASGEKVGLNDPRLANCVFDVEVIGRPNVFQFATRVNPHNHGENQIIDLHSGISHYQGIISTAEAKEAELNYQQGQFFFNSAVAMDYYFYQDSRRAEKAQAKTGLNDVLQILTTGQIDDRTVTQSCMNVFNATRDSQLDQHDQEKQSKELGLPEPSKVKPEDIMPPRIDGKENRAEDVEGNAYLNHQTYTIRKGQWFDKSGTAFGTMQNGYQLVCNDGRVIDLAEKRGIAMNIHFSSNPNQSHLILGLGPRETGVSGGCGLVDVNQCQTQLNVLDQDARALFQNAIKYKQEPGADQWFYQRWCARAQQYTHELSNQWSGDLCNIIGQQATTIEHNVKGINNKLDFLFGGKDGRAAFDLSKLDPASFDQSVNAIQNMMQNCHTSGGDARALGATSSQLAQQVDEQAANGALMLATAGTSAIVGQVASATRIQSLMSAGRLGTTLQTLNEAQSLRVATALGATTQFLAATATGGTAAQLFRYHPDQSWSQISGSYLEAMTMSCDLGQVLKFARGAQPAEKTVANALNQGLFNKGALNTALCKEALFNQSGLFLNSYKDALGFWAANNLRHGQSPLDGFRNGKWMDTLSRITWSAGAMYLGHVITGGISYQNIQRARQLQQLRGQGLVDAATAATTNTLWSNFKQSSFSRAFDEFAWGLPHTMANASLYSGLDASWDARRLGLHGSDFLGYVLSSAAEGATPMFFGHLASSFGGHALSTLADRFAGKRPGIRNYYDSGLSQSTDGTEHRVPLPDLTEALRSGQITRQQLEMLRVDPAYLGRVNRILSNLKETGFSHEDYEHVLSKFQPSRRALAEAILNRSLANTSEFSFRENQIASARALKDALQQNGDSLSQIPYLYTLSAGAEGNLEAYRFRKANDLQQVGIHSFDYLPQDVNGSTKSIVLFGNLQKATPAQLKTLIDLSHSGKRIYLVDNNNFSKGISFFDNDRDAVFNKLNNLVGRAQLLQSIRPDLKNASADLLAQRVLNGDQDRLAASLGIHVIRPGVVDPNQVFAPRVTREKIEQFLEKECPDLMQRAWGAHVLEAGEYKSVNKMIADSRNLRSAIALELGRKALGIEPTAQNLDRIREAGERLEQSAVYVVGVDKGSRNWLVPEGASDAYISYLYRTANNLPEDRFVSMKQLEEMKASGALGNRPVIHLDDTIYSGQQVTDSVINCFLKDYPNVVIGRYGSYYKWARNRFAQNDNRITTVTLATHYALNPNENYVSDLDSQRPCYLSIDSLTARLTSESNPARKRQLLNQLNYLQTLDRFLHSRGRGYQQLDSYQIFPYMTSDTSAKFISKFAKEVLGISNPQDGNFPFPSAAPSTSNW